MWGFIAAPKTVGSWYSLWRLRSRRFFSLGGDIPGRGLIVVLDARGEGFGDTDMCLGTLMVTRKGYGCGDIVVRSAGVYWGFDLRGIWVGFKLPLNPFVWVYPTDWIEAAGLPICRDPGKGTGWGLWRRRWKRTWEKCGQRDWWWLLIIFYLLERTLWAGPFSLGSCSFVIRPTEGCSFPWDWPAVDGQENLERRCCPWMKSKKGR